MTTRMQKWLPWVIFGLASAGVVCWFLSGSDVTVPLVLLVLAWGALSIYLSKE